MVRWVHHLLLIRTVFRHRGPVMGPPSTSLPIVLAPGATQPDMAARLSDKESQFARDYFVLFGSHMKAAAANHLPGAGACAESYGALQALLEQLAADMCSMEHVALQPC